MVSRPRNQRFLQTETKESRDVPLDLEGIGAAAFFWNQPDPADQRPEHVTGLARGDPVGAELVPEPVEVAREKRRRDLPEVDNHVRLAQGYLVGPEGLEPLPSCSMTVSMAAGGSRPRDVTSWFCSRSKTASSRRR